MLENLERIKFQNRFKHLLCLILGFLKLFHAVISILIVSIQRLMPQPKDPFFTIIYLISIRSYSYIVDFLINISLLYLFYCQGKLAEGKICRTSIDLENTIRMSSFRGMSYRPVQRSYNEVRDDQNIYVVNSTSPNVEKSRQLNSSSLRLNMRNNDDVHDEATEQEM